MTTLPRTSAHGGGPRGGLRRRPARLADAGALAHLERRVFRGFHEADQFSVRQFAYYLANPRTVSYVAEHERALVGYVLGIQQSGRLAHLARLHSVAVVASIRRRGQGHRLVMAFLEEARRRGCTTTVLEVAEANRASRRLFLQSGFHDWKRLPDYYGPGKHGVRMRCRLL
jgi:ribosomal-protein-alanine N-acetyltransferase